MLAVAGANRVITIDLHAAQIQGFASFPMDNLYALPLIASYIRNTIGTDPKQIVVVAPDAGGAKRADIVAKILGCGLALCSKTRSKPNVVDSMRLVGEVEGKTAILVDDMADTMGTLCMAAELLKESGAKSVHAAVVHGVLSDPALDRLAESCLDQLVVTDTIPMSITLSDPRAAKLKVLPIAPMLAGAIQFVHKGLSLAALFRNDDPIKMAASIKWDSL
jgi:ribose-phosphate pyrophosphokinase